MLERLKKLRIAPIIQYIWSRTSDFFKKGDMFLLVMCCICTCFGITLVGSATKSYPSHTFVPIQIFAFILGLFLYYVLTVLDVSIIASRWKLLIGFETFLLLLLIPFGVSGDTGNSGWLRFFGIGIQPSEIVKVVFIVLMAKQISYLKEYKNLNSVLSILQLVVHFGYTFVLLMVTTKDLGSAIVFGAIFAVMLIVAGVRLYWFLIGGAAIALAIPFLWNNFLDEYQRLRILAPYDPSIDPDGWGITWQTTRSKYALMGGQATGLGLGHGAQTQSGALTGKHTDFIFAVAGEELGMVGCLVVVALFLGVLYTGTLIARAARDDFSMMIAGGLTIALVFQAFLNIACAIGVFPTTGKPLPFISSGGSSILASLIMVGLILSVSRDAASSDEFDRRRSSLRVVRREEDGVGDSLRDAARSGARRSAREQSYGGGRAQRNASGRTDSRTAAGRPSSRRR